MIRKSNLAIIFIEMLEKKSSNMDPVSINQNQCSKVAQILSTINIRDSFYQRPFLMIECKEEIQLYAYFFSVAICHQTHNLKHIESNIMGWDVIETVYINLMRSNSPLLDPLYIQQIRQEELEKELLIAFSEDHQCQHSTLDRIGERAGLLKDTANKILSIYSGDIREMLTQQIRLARKGGIYQTLEAFEAFSDPMRKKSSFLIKLLADAELISITDPENYIAIMDYHMQRVLMRLGCIEINDSVLKNKLLKRESIDNDLIIRERCIEAMQLISKKSGHHLWKMNDIFWTHGRSCCIDTMLCEQGYCAKSPCSFHSIIDIKDHNECIFSPVCKGASDETYRKLWQPIVETHYY